MNLIVSKSFTFEASHVLPRHPGKCSRLHGHSWGLTVSVKGSVDPKTGFVLDYSLLSDLVKKEIIDLLDHTHLGQGQAVYQGYDIKADLAGSRTSLPSFGQSFYPSSENLVIAIAKILQPLVRELASDVHLFQVTLAETCTSTAIWKEEDESNYSAS